jgi:HSP90 family molecular chaperone
MEPPQRRSPSGCASPREVTEAENAALYKSPPPTGSEPLPASTSPWSQLEFKAALFIPQEGALDMFEGSDKQQHQAVRAPCVHHGQTART